MRRDASDIRVFDAPAGNWVDRFAPPAVRPYARLARLDRPIGWWLLLWPCWWSAALAADAAGHALPNLWHIVLFLVGAIVMRGAGCVWNDVVDRDIDKAVERTRSRPIASGQVPLWAAFLWMGALSLVGLLVLLQFNRFTIATGFASLGVVVLYPLAKRVTHWPQVVLGLAFSWGALLGWTAVFGALAPAAIALYAGAIAWTIFYDTIYAHQDKEDDAIIGVKSTALLFRSRTKPMLLVFAALTVVLLAAALALANVGFLSYFGLLLFAIHLGWQMGALDIASPSVCLELFKSNRDAGFLLFGGIVLDGLVRHANFL